MAHDGTISWRELWDETASLISGRPQARWLCEQASGYDGDEFLEILDHPATEKSVAHLDAMVARVRAGEPLQYVLGRWAFRRLDLMVDPRVLIPRPETELIVDLVKDLLVGLNKPAVVVDLGTGSGAIGLAIAEEAPRDSVDVWLTDISEDALTVARANIAGVGLKASCVSIAAGRWFEALPENLRGSINVVVSNPPYIAIDDPEVEELVRLHEPSTALFSGSAGLDDISEIVSQAPNWLIEGGWLVMEIGYRQGSQVKEILYSNGFTDINIRQDLTGRDRFVVARAKG